MAYSELDAVLFSRTVRCDNSFRWFHLLGFFILAVVYYAWTWSHELGDFGGDNAYYLLTAKNFSPWSGPTSVATYFAARNPYPPLYPLFLALTGGGESLLAAHLITTTFLLAVFIVLYRWLRRLDCSASLAGLTTLLFALLPITYMQALSVLSENLYLLLSLGALAAVAAFECTRRMCWLWIAALCVAAAILTRSAGIALLAAYAFYLVLHRPPGYRPQLLIATLPFVLWSVFHEQHGMSYSTIIGQKYNNATLAEIISQFSMQAQALWQGWVGPLATNPSGVVMMGFVAVLAFVAVMMRMLQRTLDGWYVALHAGLVLVWPFPAEAARFVFVITPILIAQAIWLVNRLPVFKIGQTKLTPAYLLPVLLFVTALPNLVLTVERFAHPMPEPLAEFRHDKMWYTDTLPEALAAIVFNQALIEGMRQLSRIVPEGECVYSIKPSLLGYYSSRISMSPPGEHLGEEEFQARLRESGCHYFYTIGFTSPTYHSLYYPLDRLSTRAEVLHMATAPGWRAPAAMVLRLAPY